MNRAFRYMPEVVLISREQLDRIRLIFDHSLESDDDYLRLSVLCEDEGETDKEMCLNQ